MMEKTLVILKPCTLQRGLVGEIINRFERKGLRLAGMKMVQLTDEVLSEHYAHLSSKPFFQRVKDAMMVCPVIVCCMEEQAGAQVLHGTLDLDGDQGGQIQCWFQPDSYGLLRAELSQDGVTVVTMKFSDFSFTFPEGGAEYSTECP